MAMLKAGASVHAFDQDPDAIEAGEALVKASGGKLYLHHDVYSRMDKVLADGRD